MYHSVIIATKGRPAVLQETLASVANQDSPAGEVIISATDPRDVEPGTAGIRIVQGAVGLTTQRNAGIDALNPECELVTFLDDDVELAPDYFSRLRAFMKENPAVCGAGGLVLLDGTSRAAARNAIKQGTCGSAGNAAVASGLYGCNMSFRRSAMLGERFDERLSLYSWLEDYDFSSRVSRKGPLMLVPNMVLCHLRSPSDRMSHERFGFAQIMNPWYLSKKGIINSKELWRSHLLNAVAVNLICLLKDPRNRSRRLRGNLRAMALIARGKIEPEAVRDI